MGRTTTTWPRKSVSRRSTPRARRPGTPPKLPRRGAVLSRTPWAAAGVEYDACKVNMDKTCDAFQVPTPKTWSKKVNGRTAERVIIHLQRLKTKFLGHDVRTPTIFFFLFFSEQEFPSLSVLTILTIMNGFPPICNYQHISFLMSAFILIQIQCIHTVVPWKSAKQQQTLPVKTDIDVIVAAVKCQSACFQVVKRDWRF